MKYLLVLLLLASCTSIPQWQTINCRYFTIQTPPNFYFEPCKGYEDFTGILTNGIDTLNFAYGLNATSSFYNDEIQTKEDTINGLFSIISIIDNDIHVSIPNVNKTTAFQMTAHSHNPELMLKICRTITFPESDTSINGKSPNTFITRKLLSAKMLIQSNCASCHAMHKVNIGPSFHDIFQIRNAGYIYQYLTNRNAIKKDSLTLEWIKTYNTECVNFDNLSRGDIESIISYGRQ